MVANGKSDDALKERQRDLRQTDQLIEKLELEHARIGRQIEAFYEHRERAAAALEREKGLKRSQMTVAQKSAYISEHGRAA